ncbi:hypothetical protein [Legionella drancourtii]|uniref:Uncharacterized protein n=1 Tax=Legionella drancourtii LLAP12 TaxID=658187 RepID=G9EIY9_9GAMM|nr:hypothetical protein [Legionella drancourtii]EHL32752.1 hypothetical protein LDG_5146 [Legionella drancourtii LLAP12]
MNTKTIHLHKISKESLSPKEFVNLKAGDKANISYTEVVPPRLGQKDFGKITVHYKNPVYK